MKGIDIYNGTGEVDFPAVKAAGTQFVLAKTTEGATFQDASFSKFAQASVAAGIPFGAYHFLRTSDINQQAENCINMLKPQKITWPVFCDVEHKDLLTMGKDVLTDYVLTFCGLIKAAGYVPGVYASKNWFENYLNKDKIVAAGYPVWMAMYNGDLPESVDHSDICGMWQYTSSGFVNGITGRVDMNVSYVDYTAQTPTVQPVAAVTSTEVATTSTDASKPSGSAAVRSIQQRINALQIATLAVDGMNGPKTQAAVKSFQGICGLTTDAIWGQKTESAYQSISAKPKLQDGSKGIPTRYIQARVGAKVDGIFGAKTDASVKAWQKARGLTADGIVGPKTWASLIG